MIELKDLNFSYEKNNDVLKSISINIEDNSIVAILGKNGCGKSTLLNCLLGLNNIDGIFIDGKNIKDMTYTEIARNISFIPQNYHQEIDYSVFEFILFGRNPYVKLGKSLSKEDYEKAKNNAIVCGIDSILNKSITKISGGEMQLTYIARALTQDTKIIIMDEPASALDLGNQTILLKLINELIAQGKTIIFTTHNPNQLLNLNCNVLLMFNDKSYKYGDIKDILNIDNLKRIYGDYIIEKDGYFMNNLY